MPKGEKIREPPRFDVGMALLRKQDEGDDLTDGEIEIEFVPSDPFLCVHNEDDEDKNDQSTKLQEFTLNNEDFQTHQVNGEVTILINIYQVRKLLFDYCRISSF